MKIQIKLKRQRNPLVVLCRQRKAGAHKQSNRKAQRSAILLGDS